MKIVKGKQSVPWKVLVYGVPGIGKSTFGSLAPSPLLCDFEKGLDRIDGDKTPYTTEYMTGNDDAPGFYEIMRFMGETKEYQTAVIDTASGIEKILTAKILKDYPKYDTLADFGYNRGFQLLADEWSKVIDLFDWLVGRGKNILIVAHERIEKVENPSGENFDRYAVQVHKNAVPLIINRMDAALLAKFETAVIDKEEKDFANKPKKRAVGTGNRILYCEERPAWVAKNRFGLGESVPMDATIFERLQ